MIMEKRRSWRLSDAMGGDPCFCCSEVYSYLTVNGYAGRFREQMTGTRKSFVFVNVSCTAPDISLGI
jgi:hypothetical protein